MPFSNAILVHVIFLFFITLQETVHFSEMNMCNSRRYCFYWLVGAGSWKIPQPRVKPQTLNFLDDHVRQTLLVWFFELLTNWRLSQLGTVNLLRAQSSNLFSLLPSEIICPILICPSHLAGRRTIFFLVWSLGNSSTAEHELSLATSPWCFK
jgi:hypothetical protein